jgi:hypothetical protein
MCGVSRSLVRLEMLPRCCPSDDRHAPPLGPKRWGICRVKGSATTKCSPQLPKRRATERDQDAIDRSWLVVERLPAYAPDLNPVEGLWSSLKAVELTNLTMPTLAEVIDQAHPGHRPDPPHPTACLLLPATYRPVGLMRLSVQHPGPSF